ncbi:hypothetical protein WJX74_005771 [Apatococcus lobatus]|uniref:J domain-containing protein n=1 Tax=Apatococcus lobatus TaxID=904363 RepID=A0AAW1RF78_9CHLO
MPMSLLDQDEAGSIWRSQKLEDFGWRAKVLGCPADPAIQQLLREIQLHTSELEELRKKQAEPHYQRPWWADGEYDYNRADRANDEGLQSLALQKYAEAFDRFTAAIRLCPSKAVYHCNRSAVALKLKQPSIALQDAREAVARDSQYAKAYLRAGSACLLLARPQEAADSFQQVLSLAPDSAAAKAGLSKATAAAGSAMQAATAATIDSRASAERPGLSRTAMPLEAAALQLESARAMRAANPGLEAAECVFAEAMISCGRHAAAREAAKECLAAWPAHQAYLLAEAFWREGDVPAAMATLASHAQPADSTASALLHPDCTSSTARPAHQHSTMHAGGLKTCTNFDCQQQQRTQHLQQQGDQPACDSASSNGYGSHELPSGRTSVTNGCQKVLPRQKAHGHLASTLGSCTIDSTTGYMETKEDSSDDTSTGSEQQVPTAASGNSRKEPRSIKCSTPAAHSASHLRNLHQQEACEDGKPCMAEAIPASPGAMQRQSRSQDLLNFLRPLHMLQMAAQEAQEDGRYQDAIEACEEARGMLDEQACAGLAASLLSQQAAGHLGRGQHDRALICLQHALALQPGHSPSLLRRAQAYRVLGRMEDSYLDLQEVSQACPDHPGLLDQLQQAAQLCLVRQSHLAGHVAAQGLQPEHLADNHYKTLGVELDASEARLKQAYRKMAGKWHPDKWATASGPQQQHAKAVFEKIKVAYDTLCHAEDRTRYDASLFHC